MSAIGDSEDSSCLTYCGTTSKVIRLTIDDLHHRRRIALACYRAFGQSMLNSVHIFLMRSSVRRFRQPGFVTTDLILHPTPATELARHLAVQSSQIQALRYERGLSPNSTRKARLKFETSPNPQSSAISRIFVDSSFSRVAARRSLVRRRYW